jgi:hypothetical protein
VLGFRRFASVTAILLSAASSPHVAAAGQPDIVGTWAWTHKSGCAEQFVFRGDGTVSIRRGEKRTDSSYLMSWAPEPGGRYKLMLVTIKDFGGRDCAGSDESSTGKRTVLYVLFSQSGDSMIQCGSTSGADCTGLVRRGVR